MTPAHLIYCYGMPQAGENLACFDVNLQCNRDAMYGVRALSA